MAGKLIQAWWMSGAQGYTLEFQTFLPDPMNDRINGLIGAGGGARPSLTQAAGVKDEV